MGQRKVQPQDGRRRRERHPPRASIPMLSRCLQSSKLCSNSAARSGFSAVELVIAFSVLALIAGAMSLKFASIAEDDRVARALKNIELIRQASQRHHADTGEFAREYAGAAARDRLLSGTQTSSGWSGPYLVSPMVLHGNPWRGTTHLYNSVTENGWIPGFDLDGDGTYEIAGAGNMLYFANVDASAAKKVDEAIDEAVQEVASAAVRRKPDRSINQFFESQRESAADSSAAPQAPAAAEAESSTASSGLVLSGRWEDVGRVRYVSASKTLLVLVHW